MMSQGLQRAYPRLKMVSETDFSPVLAIAYYIVV
jgi:hypothetical protein